MEIIDLGPENEELYLQCLEDWSEEMKEAGDHKSRWYARMKDRGLRVKLARDESGTVGGMIQYLPIEEYGLLRLGARPQRRPGQLPEAGHGQGPAAGRGGG